MLKLRLLLVVIMVLAFAIAVATAGKDKDGRTTVGCNGKRRARRSRSKRSINICNYFGGANKPGNTNIVPGDDNIINPGFNPGFNPGAIGNSAIGGGRK
ncbi:5297_t:CDS:2 [Paraglomus occultum]|uniref:5297_t:CDS:1 n=1 Tax=Paraglomus occultum TaxID=144539 RepID=A0A9N9B1D5_9GLOM|nr:5297_t:CDS:2 [Paraglomus occultum]